MRTIMHSNRKRFNEPLYATVFDDGSKLGYRYITHDGASLTYEWDEKSERPKFVGARQRRDEYSPHYIKGWKPLYRLNVFPKK